MSLIAPRILIVEDEPSQVEVLRYNLKQEGYALRVICDGEEGLQSAIEDPPDLILLDWMLPNLSGVEICRQLRRHSDTRDVPIIMLTARTQERDKIQGLDVGADDYVSKPYSVKELIARIRAALRRPKGGVFDRKLSVGKLEADIEKHRVTFDGKILLVSPIEFKLIVALMQRPERVLSRGQLLDLVWGVSSELETRTVDVHIGRLRRSLDKIGGKGIIRTIRGFGYSVGSGE